jgi:hypothetical protein
LPSDPEATPIITFSGTTKEGDRIDIASISTYTHIHTVEITMTGAHVFNVPQPYRAQHEAAVEKPRTRFRWFGHGLRLGGSTSKHTSPAADRYSQPSRRTHSSYISSDHDIFSPASSPRATAKSLTSEDDLTKLHDASSSSSLLKLGLLGRRHNNDSVRSSIASTVSSSSDDLSSPVSPPSTAFASKNVEKVEAATWQDEAHIRRHYGELRWRIVRIQADGNCLFRAVSDQIYRNEAFHADMRRRVVEYIAREKELFRPFVENEQAGKYEHIDAYCKRMQQDAQWGGNPELFAVARLFNVRIYVHQGPKRRLSIESGRVEAPEMEINLLFRNDHYDSLHDEAHLDEKPRLSTTVAQDLLGEEVAEDEDARRTEVEDNQQDEAPASDKQMKKNKKRVVFIGEQTRVERVEVEPPQVVVQVPVRYIVRDGKVCSVEEPQPEKEVEEVTQASECPVPAPEEPSKKQEKDDGVVRVQRVSFRRGRRVAA